MRKHRLILLILTTLIIWAPAKGNAQLSRGFGGRVLTTGKQTAVAVVCAALYGPFTIAPVGVYPIGLYQIPFSTKMGPSTGGWVLGSYNLIPDTSTCYNPETGAPIPSFRVTNYGASRGLGF